MVARARVKSGLTHGGVRDWEITPAVAAARNKSP